MSQDTVIMFFSVCWCLLFLDPLNHVFSSPCGSTKTLNVEEGKDVILQLDQQTPITSTTWEFEKHLIATTKPGQPLELGKHSSSYIGRLFTLDEGSLRITTLTTKDRRIYRAELFNKDSNYICAQLFDLRIDEPSRIPPDIEPSESCGTTIRLVGTLGGEVTLQLPNHPNVAFITWDINNIDHIAITGPGQVLEVKNNNYVGRLSATTDGSLKISGLTTKDQRVYRAELFTGYWIYRCTQFYDIRVKINVDQPVITISPNEVTLGQEVVLRCESKRGSFPKQYQFYTKERFLGSDRIQQKGVGQLRLTITLLSMAGPYYCGSNNDISRKEKKSNMAILTIKIGVDQPVMTISPNEVTVGQDVVLRCESKRGSFPIQYMFYNEEGFLGNVTSSKEGAAQLWLTNTSLSMAGPYYCGSHNDISREEVLSNMTVLTITKFNSKVSKVSEVSRSYSLQNTIRLGLSVCILIITLCILFYHMKTIKRISEHSDA
ncbi:Fc receptor-like protein 6 [Mixophyes fleayi]|uniref:Fc receptor-like protein 6 n=1 Tax=Mixophyes fleayi TaxID=3061075 RepID=UPI003F4DDA6E